MVALNKKAALLTISTFLIFISFVTLFSIVESQNNNINTEAIKLTSADTVFYEFDSLETS